MHIPDIKRINNNIGVHFEEILRNNWHTIVSDEKFHTSYLDNDKEVTLRFRVKDKNDNQIILEVEKEIQHITGEIPVNTETVEIDI